MRILALLTFASMLLAGPAAAFVWTEVGDAGQLLNTAQLTNGAGDLDAIDGVLDDVIDADLFKIHVHDAGVFEASTEGASFDSQLFLFDSSGLGVTHNDDYPVLFGGSRITGQFLSGPGDFYLAISGFDVDPRSAGGSIWLNGSPLLELEPDGPGRNAPLSGWTQNGFQPEPSEYRIELQGARFVTNPVPEPGTVVLLALGLGGAAIMTRRRGR